jgi:1,4-alpha-glucan branching enzyme
VTWEAEDAYRFPPVLGSLDVYLMAEGSHRRIFERLGRTRPQSKGVDGVAFAVWAPNARRVSVVGEWNQWDGRRHPMRKRIEAGIWELFVPGAAAGQLYKYEIVGSDGSLLPLKSDPVGFEQEAPPSTGFQDRRASPAQLGAMPNGWRGARRTRASVRRSPSMRCISARGAARRATAS